MSDWLFNEAYRTQYDLQPTQQREAAKRLAKKNIVDVMAASDEIEAVLRAVHTAYGNKKERARAASAKSRASKKDDVADAVEDAAVTCEPNVCDAAVECVAEAVPEPAAPQVAPTPVVAASDKRKKSVARADNVADPCVTPAALVAAGTPAVAPTQAPKRLVEAAPRRGLCAMVASASI